MADETTQPNANAGGQTAQVHVVVEERTRRGCCLGRIVGALVTVFILFIILANTVAPYRVDSHIVNGVEQSKGMEPTLHVGQTIFAHSDRFVGLTFHTPARSAIVIYHSPKDTNTTLVGRVIAIPGDTIEVTSDAVILNGQTLTEKYIATPAPGQPENQQTYASTKLDTNQYFIMNDNRAADVNKDSRDFGPVPFDHIVGEVWITLG